ncbi:hypothetical protein NK662_19710 [Ectobacillus sp. SYSU M60031]|uniref:Uncharacterized protein n=1 Tax=Ectobacillus ponti TaxID=2961894 RepID=A0AA41XD97_9BACI|nr:hypothetical protein [Ectobacillus ponti]
MRELVGTCHACGTEVYCTGGFLNGIVQDGNTFCIRCAEHEGDKAWKNLSNGDCRPISGAD